jgi:hypothetical protein
MSKMLMMMSLSLVFLASCARFTGDFCDLAVRFETDDATARYLLTHDRALIIDMNVQNRLLERCP